MTPPPHRPVVAGTCLAAAAVLLLTPATAFPCSCLPSPSPCTSFGSSSVIFVGTPVAVEGAGELRRYRFTIDDPIQNMTSKTAEVTTGRDTAMCGYPFTVGEKYLVYANAHDGGYTVSLCSRTGPLEARRDDVELLRQTAAGTARPRLFGSVYRLALLLDGAFMHHEAAGGVPDVPIRVVDAGTAREARTDRNGRFTIDGLTPGTYDVRVQLPAPLAPLFDEPIAARIDRCSGEVGVAVTTVPLRGTVRAAPGETPVRQVMLRVVQVESGGRVDPGRSTLAFTEPDGTWKVPGLPAGRYVVGVSTFDVPTPHTPYPTQWHGQAARPENATVLDVTDNGSVTVDFQLPRRIPELTVSGTTVGADGKPTKNVWVALIDADAVAGFPDVGHATSDDNGGFTITGLRGRRYRLRGQEGRPGGTTSDTIDVTDAELAGRPVTLTMKARP